MSGTGEYIPVPVTNGFSPIIPSPGWVIERVIPSDGTTGSSERVERIYPCSQSNQEAKL